MKGVAVDQGVFSPTMIIAGRPVGSGHPVYVIAEMSANHHQDYDRAVRLIEAAKAAGADAIKLQDYTPEGMTVRSDDPAFRIGGGTLWDGRSLYDLYAEARTPLAWFAPLREVASRLGLDFFASAFDAAGITRLEGLDVPVHKIASFELVDLPLIAAAARTGKPLILSTGMASEAEIDEAVATAREAGAREIALLKCCSAYPAAPETMHLRTIPYLQARYGCPVGLSDHTLGTAVAVASVALGAGLIEKHLTLSRTEPGPDAAFSLEPDEFAVLVSAVREAQAALGGIQLGPTPDEAKSLQFRRSLFVVTDMAPGEPFTEANLRSLRPASGLAPRYLPDVLGRRAASRIAAGTPLDWSLIAPS